MEADEKDEKKEPEKRWAMDMGYEEETDDSADWSESWTATEGD